MKSIFEFNDYKEFIQMWIKHHPQRGKGLLGKLSGYLNINSTFISQVLHRDKHFSSEQALDCSEFMALTGLEKEYFLLLHQFGRAGNHKLKSYLKEKIKRVQSESAKVENRLKVEKSLSEVDKSIFYSSWVYSAIRLFCSLDKFSKQGGATINEISERFLLTHEDTLEILEFLTKAGLLKNENGLFQLGAQTTHIDKKSPHRSKHHINWRVKSLQRLDLKSDTDLFFTAPFSISKQNFDHAKEKILQLISEFQSIATESTSEEMACFNIDFFKLD